MVVNTILYYFRKKEEFRVLGREKHKIHHNLVFSDENDQNKG
jgi:hypothetical protein